MADNKARRRRKIFNPRGANAFETDAKDPDRTQEKSIPCKGCFRPKLEGNSCRQIWTPDALKLFRARMTSVPFGPINFDYAELTMGNQLVPVNRHTPESFQLNATGDGWQEDEIAERHQIFDQEYLDGVVPWIVSGDLLLTFNDISAPPNCSSQNSRRKTYLDPLQPIAEHSATYGDFDGPVPPPALVGTAQPGDEVNFPGRITGVHYNESLQATSNFGFGSFDFNGANGGFAANTEIWHSGSFQYSGITASFVAGVFGQPDSIQFTRFTLPQFHNGPEIRFTSQLASPGNLPAFYQQQQPPALVESMAFQPGNGWTGSYFDGSIGVGGSVPVDVSSRGSGGNQGVNVIRLGPF